MNAIERDVAKKMHEIIAIFAEGARRLSIAVTWARFKKRQRRLRPLQKLSAKVKGAGGKRRC